jgi:hypothetical protein
MGITCYTVRPTARCMYWHYNNGAYLTDGHSVTPAQVTSTRVKEESIQDAPLRRVRFWHLPDIDARAGAWERAFDSSISNNGPPL